MKKYSYSSLYFLLLYFGKFLESVSEIFFENCKLFDELNEEFLQFRKSNYNQIQKFPNQKEEPFVTFQLWKVSNLSYAYEIRIFFPHSILVRYTLNLMSRYYEWIMTHWYDFSLWKYANEFCTM